MRSRKVHGLSTKGWLIRAIKTTKTPLWGPSTHFREDRQEQTAWQLICIEIEKFICRAGKLIYEKKPPQSLGGMPQDPENLISWINVGARTGDFTFFLFICPPLSHTSFTLPFILNPPPCVYAVKDLHQRKAIMQQPQTPVPHQRNCDGWALSAAKPRKSRLRSGEETCFVYADPGEETWDLFP